MWILYKEKEREKCYMPLRVDNGENFEKDGGEYGNILVVMLF